MARRSSRLSPDEWQLLRDIVLQRDPTAEQVISVIGVRPLTIEERERLREVLALELMEKGLRDDDEPTEFGRRVDDLIGRLGRL